MITAIGLGCACQPKRSGKRRHVERMRELTRGVTLRRIVRWRIITVTAENVLATREQLGVILKVPAHTERWTWPGTCGSGSMTGIIFYIIASHQKVTPRGRRAAPIVYCVAARGSTMRTTCALLPATETIHPTLTRSVAPSVFVAPVVHPHSGLALDLDLRFLIYDQQITRQIRTSRTARLRRDKCIIQPIGILSTIKDDSPFNGKKHV